MIESPVIAATYSGGWGPRSGDEAARTPVRFAVAGDAGRRIAATWERATDGMTGPGSSTSTSKPQPRGYAYKKRFYRDAGVAELYDEERFSGPWKARRNRSKWARIETALDRLGPDVRRVLDLPCGTGRFTPALANRGLDVVGCDISLEMMRRARETGGAGGVFVQCDAERLPFADDALDCVVSIRFMFHVDPATRVTILREFGRTARFQIVDYRHRYSYRYMKWSVLRKMGFTRRPLERVSRDGLGREFQEAGLRVLGVFPVARFFSDKWIVVSERL
ncbi:MAG: methyltransferase domain-containing protein [Gemmatimonadota bacterium]|nr:methyltransferase domain-containing protein [Gemmatimonadota bacterium]